MARFESLDLNLLRTFDIIYAERSLSRAAKVLNVTQPAVSNALNRLRASLGDPLFVRGKRGMTPTSFADSFAPSVHEALDTIRHGLAVRGDFEPSTSRRSFRLSMNDPAEALFLHPLIVRCVASAPNVDLLCNFIDQKEIANEMAIGALDVAIEIPIPADERVRCANLINERYACVVRPGHPLVGRPLTMERYLDLEHLHVTARRRGLGHIDRTLAELNVERRIKARLRNPGTAADVVHSTDLAMTMPERFGHYYGLQALPLPFAAPPLDWQLYWPARLEDDPANRWLRAQLLEVAAAYRTRVPIAPQAQPQHD